MSQATLIETKAHMVASFKAFGSTTLNVWVTKEGNWIASSVLEELTQQGWLVKTAGKRNMWSSPKWELAPQVVATLKA